MDPQSVTTTVAAGRVVAAVSAASQVTEAVARTGFGAFLDGLYYFIMVPLVYISVFVMIAGIAIKIVSILSAPAPAYTLRTYPARRRPGLAALADTFGMGIIRKKNPVFWFFLVWFHLGILFLILGHLDLFPTINIMPVASRHMVGAGAVGVSVTVPAFYFLFRRFKGQNRQISVPSDYLLLLLILFIFLLGDMISWGNSWTANGFVMTKANFRSYFGILSSFSFADPRTVLHGSHYHFVVLHIFLAELFMMILPFSKIVHTFFSLPLNLLRRR